MRVWHDVDADGLREVGEPGFDGALVRLLDSGGAVVAATTSDATGHYGFTDLAAGTYRLELELPLGWSFSPLDQGVDDELDSDIDPVSGHSVLFSYGPGTVDRSRDVGLNGAIFEDGFESGDTSRWSTTTTP